MPMPTLVFRTVLLVATATALALALAATAGAAQWGAPPSTTHTFTLTKRDKAALAASRRAERLRTHAARQRALMQRDNRRIFAIQQLLADAEGDEHRLRAALEARLVERYVDGVDGSDLAFLLAAGGVESAIDRAQIVRDVARSDRKLAERHQVSVERLQELEAALTDVRDRHGETAASLERRADDLDVQLVAAREEHVERKDDTPAGHAHAEAAAGGTWFAAPGAVGPNAFLPSLAGTLPYSGGTLTPARPATPQQVAQVLADPRMDIYIGGRQDIAMGRIDGRVLDALTLLANQFGTLSVTSLISGHGIYTSSGNISEHSYGCAADIGTLGGVVIQPSTQGPGSVTERGVLMLASLQGDLAPHQVISLNAYGGPTLAMGDHGDHIHLGYSC